MDHFIQQLSQRAKLTPDQAKMAAQFMTEYLKTRLPAPIAGQVEAAFSGEKGGEGVLAAVKGSMGSEPGKPTGR